MINQHGMPVALRGLLEGDAPVMMEFIFTSYSTICPVQSAIFSNAQQTLNKIRRAYRMVSISIDPELDASRTLRAYGERFDAGKQSDFDRQLSRHRACSAYFRPVYAGR